MSFVDEKVMTPVYFDDIESAEKSVRDGETWGLVAMDGNFLGVSFGRHDAEWYGAQLSCAGQRCSF